MASCLPGLRHVDLAAGVARSDARRRNRPAVVARAKGNVSTSQPTRGVDPSPPGPHPIPPGVMTGLAIVQGLALVGAVVGGARARQLRLRLEKVNTQLRTINSSLRNQMETDLVPEADEQEAFKAYRNALENAMASASAAHPLETFGGDDGFSLASARREISKAIKESRDWTRDGEPIKGLAALERAEQLAIELKDPLAERGVVRAMSSCYRSMMDNRNAIKCLERGLDISGKIQDGYTGDADMYGEIGDLYVEEGDYEKAQEYYDKCIRAMAEDNYTASGSWDC